MKVRVYKKRVDSHNVYVMTSPNSIYAGLNKGLKFRSLELPKSVVEAIVACNPGQQSRIFKILYKGAR